MRLELMKVDLVFVHSEIAVDSFLKYILFSYSCRILQSLFVHIPGRRVLGLELHETDCGTERRRL
jgi:hypothetical protein